MTTPAELEQLESSPLWNYVGEVCRCSKGELGLVTAVKILPWGVAAVGVKLTDGTQWSSRTPAIVEWTDVVKLADGAPTQTSVGSMAAQIATFREELRLAKEEIALLRSIDKQRDPLEIGA